MSAKSHADSSAKSSPSISHSALAPNRAAQPNTAPHAGMLSRCACGGGCPRCASGGAIQRQAQDGVVQLQINGVVQRDHHDASPAEEPVKEEEPPSGGHVHAKLIVGSQNDPSEREADAVADAVIAGGPSAAAPDRAAPASNSDHGAESDHAGAANHGGAPSSAPSVSSALARGAVSRAAVADSGITPSPEAAQSIQDPGAGSPLSSETRSLMESRMGADFGHVRVHTDDRAQSAARSLQAKAFTMGADIWMGQGQSTHDHRLMAHELTHVVQQRHAAPLARGSEAAAPSAPIQRTPITAPAKLVSWIEGPVIKGQDSPELNPATGKVEPRTAHTWEHYKWHAMDHPTPSLASRIGKLASTNSFGGKFMEFHTTMMAGFATANGARATPPWSATTAPPAGDYSEFTDPVKLAAIPDANSFGNKIVDPHDESHGYFEGAGHKGMNSFYWATRHDVFYQLHTWIDDRYLEWKALKKAGAAKAAPAPAAPPAPGPAAPPAAPPP